MSRLYSVIEWEQLHDAFYHKTPLYTLQWDGIDPTELMTAVSPNGGAIAITKDETNLKSYMNIEKVELYSIYIFSQSGKLLTKITWDKVSVVGLGWTKDEKLVIVSRNGFARVYDMQGDFHQFSLGKEAENKGLSECKFWPSGFVARLNGGIFLSITNYSEPRRKVLYHDDTQDFAQVKLPLWELMPSQSMDQQMDILLYNEGRFIVIDEQAYQTFGVDTDGDIIALAVSPNNHYVAAYTSTETVYAFSTGMYKQLVAHKLPDVLASGSLRQLLWCGNDSIALIHYNLLTLVGPFGGSVPFLLEETPFAISELDGLRLISQSRTELVRKVPDSLFKLFRVGSTSPGAKLIEASQLLKQKNIHGEALLLQLGKQLEDAVKDCVDAAVDEHSVEWQNALLEAAYLGVENCANYDRQNYVQVCQDLRVLNALRKPDIAIYITACEYASIGLEAVTDKLAARGHYALAVHISRWMKAPCDWVYLVWAQRYIKSSHEPEEVMLDAIVNRLSSCEYISYESLARTAYEEGRIVLSTKLLSHEPLARHQVMLLLDMNAYEQALERAVETFDYNVILYVLLRVRRQVSIADFFRMLNKYPTAADVFKSYASVNERDKLHDYYYQDDDKKGIINLAMEDAFLQKEFNQKLTKLKVASKLCHDNKLFTVEGTCLDEQIRLYRLEEECENLYQEQFIGLTVSAFVFKLIEMNQEQRALKVKSEFQIPEKRFAWLKLRALLAIRDWVQLEQWAASLRKSPIGFKAFFYEIYAAGNKKEAAKYIPRCTEVSAEERAEMWMLVGDVKHASEEATKAKNTNLLKDMLDRLQEAPESRFVQQALGQLRR
ncbi:HOPS complex subunit Vps16 [Schizosaccharomyces japonicus yFS275]|uniref:Probable vacuolar protein sorting-associated protein 16 homolog n=1 Tax=Schizosaccharomyces japonicus (strain yFS275 / FY16936) TaxID=402676 RepID=B6JYD8_SCHJY|nr:HOPS complex subunit Vps16 [Schizosaccharomyces japonicus yFS275]EEB06556.2 HOPS complex subunit Vps16 [Schizosaccharomyces japonicus yFS275]